MSKLLTGLTVLAVAFIVTPSEGSECELENEKYEECPNRLCSPQYCSQLGFPISCEDSSDDSLCSGNPGYVCVDGYVRNDDGDCVPINECPSCGGDPNAKSGCGVNCGKKCSNHNKKSLICPRICKPNACDCKDGYVYDDNIKKCVFPEECTPVCEINEVYSDCINGGCRGAKACSEIGQPVRCVKIDPTHCIKGCLCQDGYLRAENGTCVPENQCETSCNGDPNAKPGCGVNCGRLCSNYNKEPQSCIQVCYENACDCKPDYVFDDNIKKCVLPEECSPVCTENEVFSDCIEGQCQTKECSQLGQSVPCPRIDPAYCTKGCLCKEGYLRADNGTCVPQDQCDTSCNGDPNAKPGCGVNCGRLCSNYNKEPQSCILVCYENACDCKPDYVFDDNIKKCVLPKECSPVCTENEVFSDCIEGQCQTKECSQLGQSVSCPRIDPAYCTKGCLCIEGYLRADNGTCVPQDQCDIGCGGDRNAKPGCSLNCNKHCSNVGKAPGKCPRIACPPNGCECKKGFYFDKDRKSCVLPEDCPRTTDT